MTERLRDGENINSKYEIRNKFELHKYKMTETLKLRLRELETEGLRE